MSIRLARIVLLIVAGIAMASHLSAQTQQPSILDAVQQLKAGDAFRALLTLNEIVARPGLDSPTLARAHAIRAMAFLEQNQPERAQAAVALALQADPSFVPGASEINGATITLFEAARRPRGANLETEAQRAEQAGNFQAAFLDYLAAYQALPNPPPADDDRRLRERIITIVQKLPTTPAIPPVAREHVTKADALLEAEAILGGAGGASSQAAANELRSAVRSAPWWPEATFKLASVLQTLKQVDEALVNLTLYRQADPSGFAASAAKNSPANAAAPSRPSAPAAVPSRAAPVGKILVYRPGSSNAQWARPNLECNGVKMAELQNGRMVEFTIPAGDHAMNFGRNKFTITIEAGKTYHFRTNPTFMTNWSIRETTPEEAAVEMKERKIRSNDVGRTMSAECKAQPARPATR